MTDVRRQVVEGWHVTATGDATVVFLACHPTWREPAVVYAELRAVNAIPNQVADGVREVRRRFKREPECCVMLNEGVETMGMLDGYAQAGIAIGPAPAKFTEAMGVMRVANLLRRTIPKEYSNKYAGSRRLRVHKSCHHLLSGLEGVTWHDNRPILDGDGADAVRALAAAMLVLPPEPPDPQNIVAAIARKYYPDPDRIEYNQPEDEEAWLDKWSSG